ncbi:LysR family transcriptional regulator [Enterobacter cloacae]|uniref:LysR family transcriptional regulator n=1 Tax=Enterobacter cloacae TaxID=550 RepID=A0A377LUI3_ENTCL|nr:LysR family transcriptional regulator [Enterobacter cloacae]
MDKLRGMETFIAVVESGSFTGRPPGWICRR